MIDNKLVEELQAINAEIKRLETRRDEIEKQLPELWVIVGSGKFEWGESVVFAGEFDDALQFTQKYNYKFYAAYVSPKGKDYQIQPNIQNSQNRVAGTMHRILPDDTLWGEAQEFLNRGNS